MAASKKTLSEKQFQVLVRKFRKLREETESASVDTKLQTYWTYGDLITEQKLLEDAGYHNSILKDLSRETGISLRTLQQSVHFRRTYRRPPKDLDLSWAHLRVLVRLSSKKERDFYAALAKKESWTSRQLQKAIQSDLYSGGELPKPKLSRPGTAAYLYRAKNVRVIDGDTLEVLIDLGFHSFSQQRIRLAQINCPEVDSPEGRAARNLLTEHLATAKTIVLKTKKSDLHGRYIAHVFVSPRRLSIDECFEKGLHLNDLLVREGHARIVG